jgi:hypothetical protein
LIFSSRSFFPRDIVNFIDLWMDIAVTAALWCQHWPSYDNNRAVQIPSPEPGHTVRRKRKS